MDEAKTKHFEKIGIQQRLFTRAQLGAALQAARQQGRGVGEVLLAQRILTAEQLKGLERAVSYRLGRDEDKEIAKIIIDSNYCQAESVEEAMRKQKEFYAKTGELMRLGVLLVQARDLSESQRIAAHKIHLIEQKGSSGLGAGGLGSGGLGAGGLGAGGLAMGGMAGPF
ncbi:MAG: hypothetical protein AB7N76_24390 [Planctomycetota bacterium]